MSTFKRYFPNALSVLRLVLGPLFPFLPEVAWIPVFVVAALTEWLDGFLSRWWSVETTFGRILDPIADKVFVLGMIVTFLLRDYAQPWEMGLIMIRDVVVVLGAMLILAFGRDRSEWTRMSARWPGKIATNFQFLVLLSLLFLHDVHLALIIVTTVASIVAAVDYMRFYFREVKLEVEADALTSSSQESQTTPQES